MESLLNSTMDSSLFESCSKKLTDRPVERIRFATPEAERRYIKILKVLQKNGNKGDRSKSLQFPSSLQRSDSSLNLGKKRSLCSEDDSELSEPSGKKSRFVVAGKKFEDPFIASLGPIPPSTSDIFANTSFVLCYASDSGQCVNHERSDQDEAQECWKEQPFYSEDRLIVQIKAGGGKVYESFNQVPKEEHERTKLITNAPSFHPQRILCSKAGIPAYSHRWIIRCCQQNKPLDPSPDEIPTLNKADHSGCATCSQSW